MSSLEEVSNLLVEQNTVLALQANATMNTNKEIKKLTGYFTGLDAEERRRESSPAIDVPAASNIESEGRQASSGITAGMLITPGLILDLAKRFAFRLLRGGLIVALADNIGKAVSEFFGAEEFQGEITRALTFAGIGSIFGAKFAAIGLALGAVLDEETLAKITPIIEDISKSVQQFAKDYLPSIDTLQKGLITGLEGIRNLLSGDFKALWEGGQVEETLLLLAGLGTILMPGKALAGVIVTAKTSWRLVISSIRMLGGLASLISGAGAVAAAPLAGQLMTDDRGRQYVQNFDKKTGKRLLPDYSKKGIQEATKTAARGGGLIGLRALLPAVAAFITGPVALTALGITTVAGLGYLATNAFMETDTYKALKKRSDDIGKVLDEGVEGQGPMSLQETSYSDMNPASRFAADTLFNPRMQVYQNPSASADINRFATRQRNIEANIVNAPQMSSSSSSSVVQHNQVMNSGSGDPADQVFGGNLAY